MAWQAICTLLGRTTTFTACTAALNLFVLACAYVIGRKYCMRHQCHCQHTERGINKDYYNEARLLRDRARLLYEATLEFARVDHRILELLLARENRRYTNRGGVENDDEECGNCGNIKNGKGCCHFDEYGRSSDGSRHCENSYTNRHVDDGEDTNNCRVSNLTIVDSAPRCCRENNRSATDECKDGEKDKNSNNYKDSDKCKENVNRKDSYSSKDNDYGEHSNRSKDIDLGKEIDKCKDSYDCRDSEKCEDSNKCEDRDKRKESDHRKDYDRSNNNDHIINCDKSKEIDHSKDSDKCERSKDVHLSKDNSKNRDKSNDIDLSKVGNHSKGSYCIKNSDNSKDIERIYLFI